MKLGLKLKSPLGGYGQKAEGPWPKLGTLHPPIKHMFHRFNGKLEAIL